MKLHENKKLFRQAVQFTAQKMNLPDIYIEKDYWVTYVLSAIFHNEIGKETIFKGGTALSKCFGYIQRFSEDIDLVMIRNHGESDGQLKNKIKKISKIVAAVLPEIEIPGLTRKRGMSRKTAHSYSKEFKAEYGQIRDVIIVEATWFGHYEPYSKRQISTYIYDMMTANGQKDLAAEYELLPFDLFVLDPRRTICEKIMSLTRFSYSENFPYDLKNKIRHIYDLHQLLKEKDLAEFFVSNDFDAMLKDVARHDLLSFRNNNNWLDFHPNESKFFANPKLIWKELKRTYLNEFKPLVYGEFPDETLVLETIEYIQKRLAAVIWDI
ncbi:MAG: nucleotidyl transferase AbiEii/AbiGii toxin family protein [Chlorobi bacterium]|nr:nucleotidyl transferase AbiEii/AbiGii toxin family protein [Chlorobiota bacterium]